MEKESLLVQMSTRNEYVSLIIPECQKQKLVYNFTLSLELDSNAVADRFFFVNGDTAIAAFQYNASSFPDCSHPRGSPATFVSVLRNLQGPRTAC